MAALNETQKRYVVQQLACFRTPSEVVEAVKAEFGVEVSRQQVQGYDPTSVQGARLSRHWREVFDATREAYIETVAEVPVAHQRYRLDLLQRGVEAAVRSKNWVLVADLAERAAKEVGGAYTNRRELSGPGGGPIGTIDYSKLSDEQLERLTKGEDPATVLRSGPGGG